MGAINSDSPILRLVVVEDNDIVRAGVAAAIGAEPNVEVIGQAASVAAARKLIAERQPDIAILDLSLPDGSGRELVEHFATAMPQLRCIVHTGSVGAAEASSLAEAGAAAVVLKSLRGTDLIDAIRNVGRHVVEESRGIS